MELLDDNSRLETLINCSTISVKEFNLQSYNSSNREPLSCLNINIHSLRGNFNSLLLFLHSIKLSFTFIVITETWLDEVVDVGLHVDGYKVCDTYRNADGGGIKLFYREHLCVEVNDIFSGVFLSHECLTVCARLPLIGDLHIGCIYRPPHASINSFNLWLSHYLDSFSNKKCLVVGDLNLNMLKTNKSLNERSFQNTMSMLNFTNFISLPTFVNPQTGIPTSCLDHIWCNALLNNSSFVFREMFSDHLPAAIIFDTMISMPKTKIKFRNFSKQNINKFLRLIDPLLTSLNIPTDDINNAVDLFIDQVKLITDACFPIMTKIVSQKRLNFPWMSNQIVKLIRFKHRCLYFLKRGEISYHFFKLYSSLLKNLIKLAERNYYKREFLLNQGNPKGTWNKIDKLLGRNKTSISNFFSIDSCDVYDSQEIANKFNEYFTTVPHTIQNNIPQSYSDYTSLIKFNPKSIFIYPSSPAEVSAIIRKLKSGNNLNDIPVKLLKLASDAFGRVISCLFNISVEKSSFPNSLKIAKIQPIFKSGKKYLIENHRPISILPILDKIFEKLLVSRLNSFVSKCSLISVNQFGFQKGCSTQHAALKLCHRIMPAFSENKFSVAVFIDFSKAFDTVNHTILLQKLHRMGIRGHAYSYIKSYLSYRKQCTIYKGKLSAQSNVTVGVPQGSCLGPLLFNLYVNDLHSCFAGLDMITYADDTVILKNGRNLVHLCLAVNLYLERISDWCRANKLSINASKTKWLLFTNKSILNMPEISIDNNIIENLPNFKYLGFTLDSKLKFKSHINLVTSKLSRICGITFYLSKFLTFKTALSIYYSFVYSIVCYGIAVWGGTLLRPQMTRLQRCQNKIVKNLFKKFFPERHTDDVYKACGILTINNIYKLHLALSMFKILNQTDMPHFLNHILALLRDHRYPTRNSSNLVTPFPRVDAIKFNFLYQGITIWNHIPLAIRNSATFSIFKNKVVKFLKS